MTTTSTPKVTHPQLVAALVKPPADIQFSLSLFTTDLWHGATGVAGEAGELLEAILIVSADTLPDRVNIREELGDLYFYMEQIEQRTGYLIDWDVADNGARNSIISPDMMLPHTAAVAVHASQVLDTIKKSAIYNKTLDTELLKNQMNSLAMAALTVGYMFGVHRGECLAANIGKLSERYANLQYSDRAAQQRADKQALDTPPQRSFFKGEPLDLPAPTTDVVTRPVPRTADSQDAVAAGVDLGAGQEP